MLLMQRFVLYTRSISTFYCWQSPQGFSIDPKDGTLAPKETRRHTAIFSPHSARVYEDFAICTYSDKVIVEEHKVNEYTKVMKVEGVGKYSYVVAKSLDSQVAPKKSKQLSASSSKEPGQDTTVNFDFIAVGKSTDRWVLVSNPSPVSYLKCGLL